MGNHPSFRTAPQYMCKNFMGLNMWGVQSAFFVLGLPVLDSWGLSISEYLLLMLLSVCITVALSFRLEFSQAFQI